jgi:hypothetical protein
MEGCLVWRRGLEISRPEAVQNCVRGLVRDNVVGKTSENGLARLDPEIAEEDATVLSRIERVSFGEGVQSDVYLVARTSPSDATAKREFEPCKDAHHNGVDVPRVEPRIVEQLFVAKAVYRPLRILAFLFARRRKNRWLVKHPCR